MELYWIVACKFSLYRSMYLYLPVGGNQRTNTSALPSGNKDPRTNWCGNFPVLRLCSVTQLRAVCRVHRRKYTRRKSPKIHRQKQELYKSLLPEGVSLQCSPSTEPRLWPSRSLTWTSFFDKNLFIGKYKNLPLGILTPSLNMTKYPKRQLG